MATSGEQVVSREPTEQDKRILDALRANCQMTPNLVNLKSVLPIMEKSGYISEERREILLKRKTQSDAATAFHILLMRKKSQALRRGFLLALKESAASVPNHQILLAALTEAAELDIKNLEEESVVGAVATGMSALSVRARACVCVCVIVHVTDNGF